MSSEINSDLKQSPAASSAEVRERIISAFRGDVFGPDTRPFAHDGHMNNFEIIKGTRPSSFYLLGHLTPAELSTMGLDTNDASELQPDFLEDTPPDEDNAGTASRDDEDGGQAEVQKKRITPSSIGLTVFVPLQCPYIDVTLRWADYIAKPPIPEAVFDGSTQKIPKDISWHRQPKTHTHRVTASDIKDAMPVSGKYIILADTSSPQRKGGALELYIRVQKTRLPRPYVQTPEKPWPEALSVTIFVINKRNTARRFKDVSSVFQMNLSAQAAAPGFIGNPDMSGFDMDDFDLSLHDLHYRDVLRFVGGRNTGTGHSDHDSQYTSQVWTDPLPSADVAKVDQNSALNELTQFNMASLAALTQTPDELVKTLMAFPDDYVNFINDQIASLDEIDVKQRRDIAKQLTDNQTDARRRMAEGVTLLGESKIARQAFRIMNLAIQSALEKRGIKDPNWRPFQLAFILLNLRSLSDPSHAERKIVDLLFFPTGGGKTEAYLGLAAFQIAHRRLTNPDWMGAGVSVIMRYTLRLLTLDQLDRAAAMICALELLRRSPEWHDEQKQPMLGLAPIEIGLWVGSAATPNIVGGRGKEDSGRHHAYTKVNDYRKNGKGAPAPIKKCPWCETEFDKDTFKVVGDRMLISCANLDCDFSSENGGLPILAVDEEIYNRLPTFIVATIDKFASLPRRGAVGRLFDHVDRISEDTSTKRLRFYGADEPGKGQHLNDLRECLPPPDLIIQDELHLISGPLGTIAGLYEAIIDRLSSRTINGQLCRPKIIASTATVRRADDQIQRLFDRDATAIFPPPGISRDNSYFAITRSLDEVSGRRYMGISALGIGPRKVLLRSLLPLLASAQKQFDIHSGDGQDNPADPYMTAMCYFNALRELGASRRIIEDEVTSYIRKWFERRARDGETQSPFAPRNMLAPEELTSRLNTDLVAAAKDRLKRSFRKNKKQKNNEKPLDVALATNMISVGLDISRLGLMLVQNQPKSAAEYIQATSRVGRDDERPGLVVVVLNMHRARDRAHYEDFDAFHSAFYRSVEATSVTPQSKRAKDRALGAIFAGLIRHLDPEMTPDNCAGDFDKNNPASIIAIEFLRKRFGDDKSIEKLIEQWEKIISDKDGQPLTWQTHKGTDEGLMHDPLADLSEIATEFNFFRAGWSMRDVQPGVQIEVEEYLARPNYSKG